MLSRNNSYFDPELCTDPHYIVIGKTNDQFCSDMLELTDILPHLHHYLRYEQGFDAVFFIDNVNILYCFDQKSMDILTGSANTGTPATSANAPTSASGSEPICSKGPLGRRRRRAAAPEPTPAPAPAQRRSLNLGRMSLEAAWQQLGALLRHTDKRCALVISNANTLQVNEDILTELASFYATNQCIIVYIFRESDLNNLTRWTQANLLMQRINTEDPVRNRVISLLVPNEQEIRNLLNHIRFTNRYPVPINAGDIEPLGEILTRCCCRKNWGITNLLNRLIRYAADHPEAVLSVDTWRQFTDDEHYLSPMEELEAMVGQEALKEQLKGWVASQQQHGEHRSRPVSSSRFAPIPANNRRLGHKLNVQLLGPPGTGKSTIARILGRFYYDIGLLPQGQFIECTPADLIRNGTGAQNVQTLVQRALGGVLFIDEAYSLAEDTISGNIGRDAINQLVADMSRYEGQFAVILAGYEQGMEQLMRTNEGLAGRFPERYVLHEYTAEQMRSIFFHMAETDNEHPTFDPVFLERSHDFFESWVNGHGRGWRNAAEAQNLLVEMKKRASLRMAAQGLRPAEQQGLCLTLADLPDSIRHCADPLVDDIQTALDRIDSLTGLRSVKKFLHELVQRLQLGETERVPGNYLFEGPPGVGKTMTARQLGELLGLLKVLRRKRNNLVECKAADLLNGSVNLNEAVEEARGGVFFLDEAHQLANSHEGRAIIRSFVPIIEDPEIHADTCFVFAGYNYEMKGFLDADVGLSRRIPVQNRIRFANYSAKELTEILRKMAEAHGEIPTQAYLDRSRFTLQRYLERREPNFGNGGFIRETYLPLSINARTQRLSRQLTGSSTGIPTQEQAASLTEEERHTLTAEDIPAIYEPLAGPVGRALVFEDDEEVVLHKIDKLVGKDALVAFAHSFVTQDNPTVFYDETKPSGMNFAVTGPEGCGKHTAIRLLTHLWYSLGLLENDEVTSLGKGDLEAGYVGQTAGKVSEAIQRALGGTVIIEYPSSMLPKSPSDNSFGPEALGRILAEIRANSTTTAFVFVDSEEGFARLQKEYPDVTGCISRIFRLDDLTPQEMLTIFHEKADNSYQLSEELSALFPDFILNLVNDRGGLGEAALSWANGTEIDKLIDRLKINWQNAGGAVYEETTSQGTLHKRLITRKEIPQELQKYLKKTTVASEEAMRELMSLAGLQTVKQSIRRIERRIRRLGKANSKPGCYVYLGHPGVGKTTVASLMGGVLRAAGTLSQGHVVIRTARQMMEQLPQFDKILKMAKNGILFIDEAHQLAQYDRGVAVIQRILTVLEDEAVTATTSIILAGYPQPMLHMLETDNGLQSRFGSEDSILLFENYNAEELMQVMEYMAARADTIRAIGSDAPLTLSDGFRQRSRAVFEYVLSQHDNDFGNARFVRNLLHDGVNQMLDRFDREYGEDGQPPEELAHTLTEADIPPKYAAIKVSEHSSAVPVTSLSTQRQTEISDLNYDDTCRRYDEHIVLIQTFSKGQPTGYGTGCIISNDGLVLTCHHVVDGFDKVRIRVNTPGAIGGDVHWFDADILSPRYKDCDMALLKIDGTNFHAASLRPADEPICQGERTLLLGYPLGDRLSKGNPNTLHTSNFAGRVASSQFSNNTEIVYIDTTGLHGNSGSPVFSQTDGRVIGVFSGSIIPGGKSLDELNYFYPIRYFWEKFVPST